MLLLSIITKRQYKNLEWFYTHLIIRQFGISMFGIFNSVYLFQILTKHFNNIFSLALTSLFFALVYFCQYLFINFAILTINKLGLRKCMLVGGIFTSLFFLILYLGKYNLLFLPLAAILGGLYLAFYYIAFHIYFTELTDDKAEGEEVAVGSVLPAIVSILGPMCAGFIISLTGFGGVFIAMGIALVTANIPLKFIPNTKDEIKIKFVDLLAPFKLKRNLNNNLALSGFAVMETTTTYLWPLFVFPILSNSFVELGFIGSLIALVSTLTTFLIGFLIDKMGPKKVLKILSLADCLVWIFRVFTFTPVQVFASSGAQALTSQGQGISIDTMVYKKSRDSYGIDPIIQREVNFALSKFLFLILTTILFVLGLPLTISFIIASVATLFATLYKI